MSAERLGFLNRNVFLGILVISLALLTVALVPYIGSVITVLIPLPFVFFLSKLGRLRGFVVIIISLVIVELVLRSIMAGVDVSFFLLLGYLGIVIHELLKKGLSIEKTVIYTVFAGSALAVIMLLFQSVMAGQMPWELVTAYITRSFQETIEISTQIGAQAEQIKFIKDNLTVFTQSFLYISPSLTLVGISFIAWLNIIVSKKVFILNGLSYPDFGELTRWKAPDGTVWFLIVAGALVLLPAVFDLHVPGFFIVGLNVLIICFFIYFLQGLAIFEFYFKTRQVPRMMQIIFYFFLILQQYLVFFIIAAGLFDLWMDFRKLTPKPPEPEE